MKKLQRKGTHTGGGLKKQAVNSQGQFVDTGKSEYTTIKKSELAQLRRQAGVSSGSEERVSSKRKLSRRG